MNMDKEQKEPKEEGEHIRLGTEKAVRVATAAGLSGSELEEYEDIFTQDLKRRDEYFKDY